LKSAVDEPGYRILIVLAGVMGADGVILAAASAHQPMHRGWHRPRRCCCFTPPAILGIVALAERAIVHARIGVAAAFGLCSPPLCSPADLSLRQYAGHSPVSNGRADRRQRC